MEDLVLREDSGAVARLTLNRPGSLNALSDAMIAALQAELTRLGDDPNIRVIVLSGVGKAFCAGHDLKEMTAGRAADDKGAAYFKDLFDRCAALMLTLPRLPQPVIAEVDGIATAAGCQLVASCDLAIASDHARFGVNGVNIGLFCSTPMVALSRNIGRKQAFEMLTTGRFISAEEAENFGLINKVVTQAELRPAVDDMANTIAAKLGSAVRIGKQAFYAQAEMSREDAYAYAGNVMVENMLNPNTAEGISAFIEKRKPDWS